MSLIRIIIQEFPWRKMKEHVLHISDLEYRSCNYHLSTKLQHVIVVSSYKKNLKICVLKNMVGQLHVPYLRRSSTGIKSILSKNSWEYTFHCYFYICFRVKDQDVMFLNMKFTICFAKFPTPF